MSSRLEDAFKKSSRPTNVCWDVPHDNIKSHEKIGFHPLFRRYISQKTTGRKGQIDVIKSDVKISVANYVRATTYIHVNLYSHRR